MRLIRILKYDLCREVAAWADEGIISIEQAESICARYGVDFHTMSRRSHGYHVLVGFGFLFIGLSLITLIGANWEEIPRAARMAGLIAITLGANLFGLVKFRRNQATAAAVWFFLGGLCYGASIMLIAQIYHIGEHYPDGIFWWAMGVLPVALLLESTLVMILSVGLGFVWFFVESSMNFYPALFPVFLAAMLWHLAQGKKSYILFICLVAGSGVWAEYTLAWLMGDGYGFRPGAENVALGAGLFLVFHGLSKWLAERKEHNLADYGTLLGLWVLRFAVVTLLVFSFKEPWRMLIVTKWDMAGAAVTASLLLSVLALWLVYQSGKSMMSTAAFVLVLNVSLLATMAVDDRTYALAFQFTDNILVVVVGIWLIVRGIQSSISHYFYVGILAISATGLLRYIDLIGDYVGASILFAILAGVLLLAARYWKNYHTKTGVTS